MIAIAAARFVVDQAVRVRTSQAIATARKYEHFGRVLFTAPDCELYLCGTDRFAIRGSDGRFGRSFGLEREADMPARINIESDEVRMDIQIDKELGYING